MTRAAAHWPTALALVLVAGLVALAGRQHIGGFPVAGSFDLEIARGTISGMSGINKFGANPDVTTASDPEDLWDGGTLYVNPTTARLHDVTSTSDQDLITGTGARTIRITGLDSAWAIQTEDLTLTGSAAATTASTYTRVYRAYVLTSGSGQTNAGDISITAQTDSSISAQILTGEGQTLMAVYSVPASKAAYLVSSYVTMNRSGGGSGNMVASLCQRTGIDTATPSVRVRHRISFEEAGTSSQQEDFAPRKKFDGPCDVWWRIDSVAGSGTTKVYGGFNMILVDD